MEAQNNNQNVYPPRVIASIKTGFQTVANHIQLIILPIILDLFLWFGPRMRINNISEGFFKEMTQSVLALGNKEFIDSFRTNLDLLRTVVEHFNLFSALRTYPIGVFSMLANQGSLNDPLGTPRLLEAPSFMTAVLLWLALAFVGLLFGTLYFGEVARFCKETVEKFSFKRMANQFGNSLIMVISLFLLLIMISIPTSIMVSILGIINPALAEVGFFIITLVAFWLIFPLMFSPHGIFFDEMNALKALVTSTRLVRYALPGSSMFLLIILLLGQGLNSLWGSAPDTSWMTLVGILGHAFVSTSLLASSFAYYSSGIKWVQYTLEKIASQQIKKNIA